MSNLFYHLTDNQWKKIKFFFLARRIRVRPPLNPRVVLNGILWILRSGARWRDLPARYGNWNTFCKVHKHGLGARKILGNQAIEISRGGYNTKIHALVNEYFQLIGVVLTGGQIHDSECAATLLSTVPS